MNCTVCGKEILKPTKSQKDRFRSCGRCYCSRECSKKYCAEISRQCMIATNKKYASERMKKNNPMSNPETREKVSQTLKRIGHKPKIQGGNGKPKTEPQILLSKKLNWDMEYVVKTSQKKNSGFPNHYKLDIANPLLKIGRLLNS